MAKLILVGSGPLEERYAAGILDTRLGRLNDAERGQARHLLETVGRAGGADTPGLLERLGRLLSKADAFDPLPAGTEEHVHVRPDIFRSVWRDALALRRSGELLRAAQAVSCPVVAIHGDYDPHPAEGVREPLSRAEATFRFILLTGCGHAPWQEKGAREEFFRVLREEIRSSADRV